jgi:hypothetical protein
MKILDYICLRINQTNLKKIIKILPAILLCVFAFNFINSEIIEQLDGRVECQQTHDYCKLVEAASIKSSSSDKVAYENFVLIDFICQHCLKQIESSKSFYEKHQNNSFYHLEIQSTYLFNQSFLI